MGAADVGPRGVERAHIGEGSGSCSFRISFRKPLFAIVALAV
jgi:hypothetical protein